MMATVDQPALKLVEEWISELAGLLNQAEGKLATLGGFCDEGLAQALVGAMGIGVGEARQQIAALRKAVRDMEEGRS